MAKRVDKQAKNTKRARVVKHEGIVVNHINAQRMRMYTQLVCPPEVDVMLRYTSTAAITGATAGTVLIHTNGPYQPQASGSTGTATGFDRWSFLYVYNRTVWFRYKIGIVNNGTVPIRLTAMNSRFDATASAGQGQAQNKNTQYIDIGSNAGGAPIKHVQGAYRVATIAETDEVETEEDWRGTFAALPTNLTYLNIYFRSLIASNYDAVLTIEVDYLVRFHGYQPDADDYIKKMYAAMVQAANKSPGGIPVVVINKS